VIMDSLKDVGLMALNILLYLRPVERSPAHTKLSVTMGYGVLVWCFGILRSRELTGDALVKKRISASSPGWFGMILLMTESVDSS